MKTISMSYSEYQDDLKTRYSRGWVDGMEAMLKIAILKPEERVKHIFDSQWGYPCEADYLEQILSAFGLKHNQNN